MCIVSTIIIGLLIGLIVCLASLRRASMKGLTLTALLGVGGAFGALVLSGAFDWYDLDDGPGFLVAIAGAAVATMIPWHRAVNSTDHWPSANRPVTRHRF
jgi:uncharacterized membrane protein YeaQ/YmgE (transglycosylase-associated protein family)